MSLLFSNYVLLHFILEIGSSRYENIRENSNLVHTEQFGINLRCQSYEGSTIVTCSQYDVLIGFQLLPSPGNHY